MIGKRLNSNYRVSLNEINSLLVGYSKAINIDAFKNKNETILLLPELQGGSPPCNSLLGYTI